MNTKTGFLFRTKRSLSHNLHPFNIFFLLQIIFASTSAMLVVANQPVSLTLVPNSQTFHRAPLSLQVYDHRYKASVDGVEIDSVMEIDPDRRIMTFRTGNGSKEIVEVHDFKNASTKKSG